MSQLYVYRLFILLPLLLRVSFQYLKLLFDYFDRALSFVPERWSRAPPPGVYAPFGDGPRYCIGKRFALIQMKCCLVKLLPHVRISPFGNTCRDGPFPVDLKSPMTLHPADSRVCLSLL